ncbi:MAG: urease accessory protein UreE [Pseudomonadota bacterium]
MTDLVAQTLRARGNWDRIFDRCTLTYDERFLRRRVIQTVHEEAFLVDLPKTVSVTPGDGFELTDGRVIEIIAAEEDLYEIRGPDLTRLAWHIGNRHTPCQIESARLVIQRDHVLKSMLEGLGATLTEISEPFFPEGGAYGHGRTLAHDHGHSHSHGHDHSHTHAH